MDYSKLTDIEFDDILLGLAKKNIDRILTLPGVYEIIKEEFNNEVLTEWGEKRFGYIFSHRGLINVDDEHEYITHDDRFDYEYGSEKGVEGSIFYKTEGKLTFKFANNIIENELKEILKTKEGKETVLAFAKENADSHTNDIEFNYDEIELEGNILTLTYGGTARIQGNLGISF